MELFVSFYDDAVLASTTSLKGSLEEQTGVSIPGDAPLASTGPSTKEEPAEEPAPMEVTTEEAAPTMKPLKGPTCLLLTAGDPAETPTALQV